MIGQLLRIKNFREKKAETEMLKSRHLLARAQQQEAEAGEALEAYRTHADSEERRLYRELCSRVVRLSQITGVQQEVACLRHAELAHEDTLAAAERAHHDASERFNHSLDGYQRASSARQKFEELLRLELERDSGLLEKKEEAEMEELSGRLRERADHEEIDHAE
jgi:type III secretion protein O